MRRPRTRPALAALALVGLLVAAAGSDRPDLLIADFEGPDYDGWIAVGEAFGTGPARGTLPGQMRVSGYLGEGLVNSYLRGDASIGTLTSPEFRIERSRINLLVGGGAHPGETCVDLLVGGEVARTATGPDSEHLRWASWDVSDLQGRMARIAIVDAHRGGWGHINVDQIVQSDEAPRVVDDRDALLERANAGTREAAERVKDDPSRPTFHVVAPGNWMNDPNGPIYYKGYYHLFYQHNPYGDDWGNMHWGHVRSRDLARWEHLPIALWPSRTLGEDHVFSGSATIGPDGRPLAFYTSIGPRPPEQWAAVPEDDDLVRWRKHPANPVLTEALHGDVKVHEWRDPFVFPVGDETYMVLGGNLNASAGGQAVVLVYRAEDRDLTRWSYRGVLFRHPDPEVKNIECPLLVPSGDRWLLIVSQGQPVDWFVGDLDPATMRFTPAGRGKIDFGQLYAPNVLMNDPEGRRILWGWVNGVPGGKGWRHCLTLPRVLTISDDGRLAQAPARSLETLRGPRRAVEGVVLRPGPNPLEGVRGEALEVRATIRPGGARVVGLDVLRSEDGSRSAPIRYDREAGMLDVAGSRAPFALGPGEPLDLHVFVDHSILEVSADRGRVWITRVVDYRPGEVGVSAHAEGGEARLEGLESWPLGSIWAGRDASGR